MFSKALLVGAVAIPAVLGLQDVTITSTTTQTVTSCPCTSPGWNGTDVFPVGTTTTSDWDASWSSTSWSWSSSTTSSASSTSSPATTTTASVTTTSATQPGVSLPNFTTPPTAGSIPAVSNFYISLRPNGEDKVRRSVSYVAFSGTEAIIVSDESQAWSLQLDAINGMLGFGNSQGYVGFDSETVAGPIRSSSSNQSYAPRVYLGWNVDNSALTFDDAQFCTATNNTIMAYWNNVAPDGCLAVELTAVPVSTTTPVANGTLTSLNGIAPALLNTNIAGNSTLIDSTNTSTIANPSIPLIYNPTDGTYYNLSFPALNLTLPEDNPNSPSLSFPYNLTNTSAPFPFTNLTFPRLFQNTSLTSPLNTSLTTPFINTTTLNAPLTNLTIPCTLPTSATNYTFSLIASNSSTLHTGTPAQLITAGNPSYPFSYIGFSGTSFASSLFTFSSQGALISATTGLAAAIPSSPTDQSAVSFIFADPQAIFSLGLVIPTCSLTCPVTGTGLPILTCAANGYTQFMTQPSFPNLSLASSSGSPADANPLVLEAVVSNQRFNGTDLAELFIASTTTVAVGTVTQTISLPTGANGLPTNIPAQITGVPTGFYP